MNRYICILRGINVSGKNLIKMADLKSSFEKMGFREVTTFIQSGNIIFSAKQKEEADAEQLISKELKKYFDADIPVMVLTKHALHLIISENPFIKEPDKDPAFMHVTFLNCTPVNIPYQEIEQKKQEGEEVHYIGKAIYLYCPNGYGNTRLNNNFFEKKLRLTATTRNWKTTNKLLEMAMNTEGNN